MLTEEVPALVDGELPVDDGSGVAAGPVTAADDIVVTEPEFVVDVCSVEEAAGDMTAPDPLMLELCVFAEPEFVVTIPDCVLVAVVVCEARAFIKFAKISTVLTKTTNAALIIIMIDFFDSCFISFIFAPHSFREYHLHCVPQNFMDPAHLMFYCRLPQPPVPAAAVQFGRLTQRLYTKQ